jgi:hypothetical protein
MRFNVFIIALIFSVSSGLSSVGQSYGHMLTICSSSGLKTVYIPNATNKDENTPSCEHECCLAPQTMALGSRIDELYLAPFSILALTRYISERLIDLPYHIALPRAPPALILTS